MLPKESVPRQVAKPPTKYASDEMWMSWIKESQAALVTLVDTLGEKDGGMAAIQIAKYFTLCEGLSPQPTIPKPYPYHGLNSCTSLTQLLL